MARAHAHDDTFKDEAETTRAFIGSDEYLALTADEQRQALKAAVNADSRYNCQPAPYED